MPRPRKCRYVEAAPLGKCFKPCHAARVYKNATTLFLDELEAIRLGDLEGLSQEEAALKMEISRSTFARIINEARRKIADAIIFSKPIITEGEEQVADNRNFKCSGCKHEWEMEHGAGCPEKCPECGGLNLNRTNCGRYYQRQGVCAAGAGHHRNQGKGKCCRNLKDKVAVHGSLKEL